MDTSKEITFGKNPIFGALAVVLPDIATDFRGDLLSLTVLDGLASRFQVPFSLSTVWRKLLDASEIARFVIACGNGHGIDMTKMSLAGALESKARASLGRQRDRKARSRLLAVLQDMDAQLDADEECGEMLDVRDGVSRLFGNRVDPAEDIRILREPERDVCKTIVRLAVEIVAKGPAAHFRTDLCRKGMTKLMTGDLHAKELESFPENERGGQMAAGSASMRPVPRNEIVRIVSYDGGVLEEWYVGCSDDDDSRSSRSEEDYGLQF